MYCFFFKTSWDNGIFKNIVIDNNRSGDGCYLFKNDDVVIKPRFRIRNLLQLNYFTIFIILAEFSE